MRCRLPSRRVDRVLLAWLLSLLLAGAAGAAGGDRPATLAAERLVLAATLNGVPTGAEPLLVRRRGTTLTVRTADLRALGIAARGEDADTVLGDVPGLVATIDDAAQVIALTYDTRRGADWRGPREAVTPNGWGAAVNYDIAATRAGGRTTLAGLVDGIVYGPRGYFYGGAIVATGDGRRATLLDAGYTAADPYAARRLTIGHLIAGATERSRPVRLLGVQVATDFSLRPDLVTTPLPAAGAAVPTAAEVIVDGQRRTGPFAPADMTIRNGVNTVTTTVRDALGRETRQTLSTYVSPVLLRRGLTAFSAEAGLVRRGYGAGDSYGPVAGSATWRAGLTDRLTLEAHGEASGRVGVAGAGAALGLGRAGLVSASLAASDAGRSGVQWGIGYERVAARLSLAARYTRSSAGWRDIAGDSGSPTRAHVAIVTLGFDLARIGTIGITAIDQGIARPGRAGARFPAFAGTLPPSRFVTASWSTRVTSRLNIVANGGIDTRRARSGYLSIGALLIAGPRAHAFAGVLARDGATGADAQWRRSAVAPGDWGYGGAVATGGVERQAADLTYQGARGRYIAEIERVNAQVAARLSARGALAIGGGGVLAADRLTSGFAVVDTGRAGVAILRDNRPVGTTDRHGRLIVADLPAFVATTISVDPQALGEDVTVGEVEHRIRPAGRAGVPVRFAIATSRAATARLLLANGDAVPAGARASLNGGAAVPVGLDGQAYLPALTARNILRVSHGGRDLCVATFDTPGRWRAGGAIGDLACAAVRSSAPSATPPPPPPRPPGSPVAAAPASRDRAAPPPRDAAARPPPA